MKMEKVGELAFLACVVIAILAGLVAGTAATNPWILVLLVVLGLVVGFLNVSEKETTPFLVAAAALIIAGTASFSPIDSVVPGLGAALDNILNYIAVFVAPAAVLVALKAVYVLASKK